MQDCPDCDGAGVVVAQVYGAPGAWRYDSPPEAEVECETCRGEGEIEGEGEGDE